MGKGGSGPIWNSLWNAPKWPLILGLFLVLIGLLFLLAGAEPIPLWRKLVGALFSELGFAFLIAFVLHYTLEFHYRYENEKEISRGILSYVYRVNLDDKLFLSTEDYIFSAQFYRSNLDIEYDFIAIRDGKAWVKYTVAYDVMNVSNAEKVYNVVSHIERSGNPSGGEPLVEGAQLGLQRMAIDNIPLSREDLIIADNALADDDDFIRCSHPLKLAAGESRRVQMVHFQEKCDRDSELWRSLYPCASLNIRVR